MIKLSKRRWVAVLAVVPLLATGSFAAGAPAAVAARGGREIVRNDVPPPVVSRAARLVRRMPASDSVRVAVVLQPPHPGAENAFLQSLQNPRSRNFHRYLTPSQWNARFAPTPAQQNAVVSWLRSQGLSVDHLYNNRLVIDASGAAAAASRAFAVKMNTYHGHGQTFYANDRNPTIPGNLAGVIQNVVLDDYGVAQPNHRVLSLHVEHHTTRGRNNISPLHGSGNRRIVRELAHLRGSRNHRASGIRPSFTNGFVDPKNLWSSYGYSVQALYNQGHCCNPLGNGGGSPVDTSIAIATACPYTATDIVSFFKQYGLAYDIQPVNVDGGPTANTNCANASNGGGFETTLDTEYSTAMSNSFGSYVNTSKVYVYEGPASGVAKNGGPLMASQTFFDLWNTILNDKLTRVMSMSWGGAEDGWSGADENSGHSILNNMLGLGISPVIASGDNGAYEDTSSNTPYVQYPGADPDVVSAGGTELHFYNDGTFHYETAWNSGGGGCSTHFAAPSYQTENAFNNLCSGQRSQPDISMNASCATGQAIYFNGGWGGVCGTSEVAPELAGLFAQINAYGLFEGSICGSAGTRACEPIGLPNYYIWHQGILNNYAYHRPFYDITTGNNDNGKGTGTYPAGAGYDLATGWGSLNALQLAREVLKYETWEFHSPVVTFSGIPTNQWYNYNAAVDWTVSDPLQGTDAAASGVGGFSQAWDSDPGNPYYHGTQGCCDTYWNGPQFPNATSGYLRLGDLGVQGCHTVNVRVWSNIGDSTDATYGPVCYDTVPPATSLLVNGAPPNAGTYQDPVQITLQPSDAYPGSGVASTDFSLDRGTTWSLYQGPFWWKPPAAGTYPIEYHSTDRAGNVETTNTTNLSFFAPTAVAFSRLTLWFAKGWTHLRWRATKRVAGFNVVVRHQKVNHRLITSRTLIYRFRVHALVRHPEVLAVPLS